jgi:hypothetical protein
MVLKPMAKYHSKDYILILHEADYPGDKLLLCFLPLHFMLSHPKFVGLRAPNENALLAHIEVR